MLFNSIEFILFFLTITVTVFFLLGRYSSRLGLIWLCAASLFFYSYWNPRYLPLLLGSITFNYLVGRSILYLKQHKNGKRSKFVLLTGIAGNLLLLSYYKYADFFITTSNSLIHTDYTLLNVMLPLGISFFTFTQIAFLVDCIRNEAREYSFIKYVLFVTYFPHLIAGPILHHKEMIPQFNENKIFKPNANYIAAGLAMFAIGLCKKLFFADGIAEVANGVFDAAHAGNISTFDAWVGALSYTLQIYFDFSGYSDMAIGLSFLFGVKLPINFYSPYKATNIIEFWRRWHMTLSRFLRDYLYIPLGGNRSGNVRRYINLIVTMVLGGLWHGAGWTFVIWGALHGFYLVLNHGWKFICERFQLTLSGFMFRSAATILTFICVVVAWVFFRAADTHTAMVIVHSMLNVSPHFEVQSLFTKEILYIAILLAIVWFFPNSLQIIRRADMALVGSEIRVDSGSLRWYQWDVTATWGVITGVFFALALLGVLAIGDGAEFLYFRF